MLETQIFTGVNPMLTSTVKFMAGNLIDSIEMDSDDSDIISINNIYNLNKPDKAAPDSVKKKRMLSLLGVDKDSVHAYTLNEYNEQLSRAFIFKGVRMPFYLALFNTDGKGIATCTTDSATFFATIEKSDKGFSLPVKLKGYQPGQLQIAMPGLAIYLLKDMAFVLISALLLILICCFSFYGMVKMFFKEKKLADVRNSFMNNMAHELKTPISSASLALELMQDASVVMTETDKKEYARIAESELKRLLLLVEKVLKMAAIERAEAVLNKQFFSVAAWLPKVLDTIKPLTERLQVDIRKTVTSDEMELWADPEHLTGLMQNLLENAIKYRHKTKRELIIDIIIDQSETEYLIVIADNGIGIPEQYIDKIFEKFFRVPTGDRHDTKGYGLGLSYVQEIVRLHKGLINVRSEEKTGTRFEIKLPKKCYNNDNNIIGRG